MARHRHRHTFKHNFK